MSENLWRVFQKTLVVAGTLLGLYLLWALREVVLVVFIAIIFASAIRPLVKRLTQFNIPQVAAVLLVYSVALGSIIGLLVVSIPPLARLSMELMSGELILRNLEELLGDVLLFVWMRFRLIVPVMALPEQLGQMLEEANSNAQDQAASMIGVTMTGLGQFVLALVISFYWLTARERILNLILLLSPSRFRSRSRQVWTDIEQTLGSYVRGQVILMLIIGFVSTAVLLALRVPNAIALGVVAGLMEAIPLVGPVLGAVPAILIALAISPIKAVAVAIAYGLIQTLEGNYLVPKVMGESVGLDPLVVIVALVAGGTLNGVIGALLAIPIAGAVQVLFRHFMVEPAKERSLQRTPGGAVLLEEPEKPIDSQLAPAAPQRSS